MNPHAKDGEEEEERTERANTSEQEEGEEEEGEEEEGKEEESEEESRTTEDDEPVGVTPGAKPGTDSSDDRPEEEGEEEEDGVNVDPVRKAARQGQHMRANPTKEENTKILSAKPSPSRHAHSHYQQTREFSKPSPSLQHLRKPRRQWRRVMLRN